MKTALLALLALFTAGTCFGDIEIRISVKFILSSTGARPTSSGGIDITTAANFGSEVTHANDVLRDTRRGYSVRVVEFIDIQPTAPAGKPADYWYNLDARSQRATLEAAAFDQTGVPWRWNRNAINIYVNNSSSGQCSFPGDGTSITLGGTIFATGTVLHEVGHIYNLHHTHSGDPDCSTFLPPANLAAALSDGDGFTVTTNDHPCYSRDQLSQATFAGRAYNALTSSEKAVVDSAFENVMSYHNENVLFDDQMDFMTFYANYDRPWSVNGHTWFVVPGGADGPNSGYAAFSALATVAGALNNVSSPADVVLLRAATYHVPANGLLNKNCTFRATRGVVTITR